MPDERPTELLCTQCAKLHPAADFCPVHQEEPLLDPAKEEVRFELMNLDDRAKVRTLVRWVVSLGAVGIVLGVFAYLGIRDLLSEEVARELRIWCVVAGAVLLGLVGEQIAKRRYRPRFTAWTKDEH